MGVREGPHGGGDNVFGVVVVVRAVVVWQETVRLLGSSGALQ